MSIDIVRFDHISMAVPELDPQIELLEKLFGFRFAGKFENDEGYFGANLEVPGRSGIGWEVLAPNGPESYLHRFLDGSSGPGLHHIAVQIESPVQAAEAMREAGAEPWGLMAREDSTEDRGMVYVHPKRGGRGFLWQLYAGRPWHRGEPFEDDEDHTLGIVAVNHVAHAAADRDDMAEWYEAMFGCQTVYSSTGDGAQSGFRTRVVETPTNQLRFEMIEPAGSHSFVQRFLDSRGEGVHHITFQVGDWGRAVEACEHHGVPVFGVNDGGEAGARWSEAFIHPKHTGGMLVQFFWEERPGTWI